MNNGIEDFNKKNENLKSSQEKERISPEKLTEINNEISDKKSNLEKREKNQELTDEELDSYLKDALENVNDISVDFNNGEKVASNLAKISESYDKNKNGGRDLYRKLKAFFS